MISDGTGLDFVDIFTIVRRWSWLILSIVAVTTGVLWARTRLTQPMYLAEVTVQLSAPPQEDVETFDQYRYVSLRDEVTLARNNFAQLLDNSEVRRRTAIALGLDSVQSRYGLEVELIRDVDFVRVAVHSSSPQLAAAIANRHVSEAIAYYGELRARPTGAASSLFEDQLRVAENALNAAEGAFATFRAQNAIFSLEDELTTYRKLLEQLELERDQRRLEELAPDQGSVAEVDRLIAEREQEVSRLLGLAPTYNQLDERVKQAREAYRQALEQSGGANAESGAAGKQLKAAEQAFADFRTKNGVLSLDQQLASYERLLEQLQLERDRRVLDESTRMNAVERVERLIAERQQELNRLLGLLPQYKVMEQNTKQARERYQHVLSKQGEAELKTAVVQAANFIQVIRAALPPSRPESNLKLLILGIIGSLGLGVLLAFVLEYLSAAKVNERPLAAPVTLNARATARTSRSQTQLNLRE